VLDREDCLAANSRSTGLQQQNTDDQNCSDDSAERSTSADWQTANVDDQQLWPRYGNLKIRGQDLDLLLSCDVNGHVNIGLAPYGLLYEYEVNLNRLSISHSCRHMRTQRFWGHGPDFLLSRDVIGHVTIGIAIYMVSYRWSFETNPISRMVAEMCCVKHLAKHIPIENALISIAVLFGQNRGF